MPDRPLSHARLAKGFKVSRRIAKPFYADARCFQPVYAKMSFYRGLSDIVTSKQPHAVSSWRHTLSAPFASVHLLQAFVKWDCTRVIFTETLDGEDDSAFVDYLEENEVTLCALAVVRCELI